VPASLCIARTAAAPPPEWRTSVLEGMPSAPRAGRRPRVAILGVAMAATLAGLRAPAFVPAPCARLGLPAAGPLGMSIAASWGWRSAWADDSLQAPEKMPSAISPEKMPSAISPGEMPMIPPVIRSSGPEIMPSGINEAFGGDPPPKNFQPRDSPDKWADLWASFQQQKPSDKDPSIDPDYLPYAGGAEANDFPAIGVLLIIAFALAAAGEFLKKVQDPVDVEAIRAAAARDPVTGDFVKPDWYNEAREPEEPVVPPPRGWGK